MKTKQQRENYMCKINEDSGTSGVIVKGLIFMSIESKKNRRKSVVQKNFLKK